MEKPSTLVQELSPRIYEILKTLDFPDSPRCREYVAGTIIKESDLLIMQGLGIFVWVLPLSLGKESKT